MPIPSFRNPVAPEQLAWIKQTLANDENSTDAEMTAYFIQNGVPPKDAAKWVGKRDKYMGNLFAENPSRGNPLYTVNYKVGRRTGRTGRLGWDRYWMPHGSVEASDSQQANDKARAAIRQRLGNVELRTQISLDPAFRQNPRGAPAGFKWEASRTGYKRKYKTLGAANRALAKLEAQGWVGAVNHLNDSYWVRLRADSFMDEMENPRRKQWGGRQSMRKLKKALKGRGTGKLTKRAWRDIVPIVERGRSFEVGAGVRRKARNPKSCRRTNPEFSVGDWVSWTDTDTQGRRVALSGKVKSINFAKGVATVRGDGGHRGHPRGKLYAFGPGGGLRHSTSPHAPHLRRNPMSLADVKAADAYGFDVGRRWFLNQSMLRPVSTTAIQREFVLYAKTQGLSPADKKEVRGVFFRAVKSGYATAKGKSNPKSKYPSFKSLPVGAKFEFSSIEEFPYSGMARGPWIKTSARGYRKADGSNDYKYTVGSVNTGVIRQGSNPSLKAHLLGGMKVYKIRLGGLEMDVRAKTKQAAMNEARKYVRKSKRNPEDLPKPKGFVETTHGYQRYYRTLSAAQKAHEKLMRQGYTKAAVVQGGNVYVVMTPKTMRNAA